MSSAADADVLLKVVRSDVDDVAAWQQVIEHVASAIGGEGLGDRRRDGARGVVEDHPHAIHTFTRVILSVVVGIGEDDIADAHVTGRLRATAEAEVDGEVAIGVVRVVIESAHAPFTELVESLGAIGEVERNRIDARGRQRRAVDAVVTDIIIRAVVDAESWERSGTKQRTTSLERRRR